MTKRKLRKNADISHPQSPHDGIHTCSKGCKKPGCNRTLRDTIEEQYQQIEALKRDVLEKTAENARLKAEVELWKLRSDNWQKFCELTRPEMTDELTRLKQEVERLTERLGGVRLIVTEEMYDELNTKYLEQQHELQNIALTARQILDEKIDLKAQVERLTKQNALATPRHLIASQDIKTLREQIEELKLENSQYEEHHKYGQNVIASLRAEVERLSKPAIIGGYNLSEYIRMANSETLEFDNGDIFADMTLPERIKYIVESHARLKAEVERLQNNCDYLDTKLDEELEKSAMLCGQVERLTDAITRGASTPDAHPHA